MYALLLQTGRPEGVGEPEGRAVSQRSQEGSGSEGVSQLALRILGPLAHPLRSR